MKCHFFLNLGTRPITRNAGKRNFFMLYMPPYLSPFKKSVQIAIETQQGSSVVERSIHVLNEFSQFVTFFEIFVWRTSYFYKINRTFQENIFYWIYVATVIGYSNIAVRNVEPWNDHETSFQGFWPNYCFSNLNAIENDIFEGGRLEDWL